MSTSGLYEVTWNMELLFLSARGRILHHWVRHSAPLLPPSASPSPPRAHGVSRPAPAAARAGRGQWRRRLGRPEGAASGPAAAAGAAQLPLFVAAFSPPCWLLLKHRSLGVTGERKRLSRAGAGGRASAPSAHRNGSRLLLLTAKRTPSSPRALPGPGQRWAWGGSAGSSRRGPEARGAGGGASEGSAAPGSQPGQAGGPVARSSNLSRGSKGGSFLKGMQQCL